jgi:hypothetical protein
MPPGIVITGLLTSIGKDSREALISKEHTKFVVKISVNSRCKRGYQKLIIKFRTIRLNSVLLTRL